MHNKIPETTSASPADERIRILFLIPSFKTGGAEIQLLSLVRGLDKSKFNITVAAFYRGSELDVLFEQIPDVSIVYLDKSGAVDFAFLKRLFALVRQNRFHIVQSYNVSARLFGTISAKVVGVPLVIATERTARLLYSSRGSWVYLFLEKFTNRWADLLIANSEAGRAFAIKRGVKKEKTHVIYNGIDLERLRVDRGAQAVRSEFAISKKFTVVGMVARMEEQKDPLVFAEAGLFLSLLHPNLRFLFVGDGPLLKTVREYVNKDGDESRFIFTGRRADVADLLHCMDIVVLTSRKVEGCSNALLEAMALGKAVIATRVGGNVELIEHNHNGMLVAPQSPEEVAAMITLLVIYPTLRKRLAENAAKTAAAKFTQAAMVQAHEQLYEKLLEEKKRNERESGDD